MSPLSYAVPDLDAFRTILRDVLRLHPSRINDSQFDEISARAHAQLVGIDAIVQTTTGAFQEEFRRRFFDEVATLLYELGGSFLGGSSLGIPLVFQAFCQIVDAFGYQFVNHYAELRHSDSLSPVFNGICTELLSSPKRFSCALMDMCGR